MNQQGFLPDGIKRAILPHPSARPLPWRLVDAKGRTRASGLTQLFGADSASGSNVHRIDFTGFSAAGSGYRLVVNGAESRPFSLDQAIYGPLARDALAYFYHNRAGTLIEARYAGGAQWARPAGHLPEKAKCVAGPDAHGNRWPGCGYSLDVTGGWYDAGDQGKYVVNGGIALWTLLNLYERQRLRGVSPAFPDGSASIPEGGNGVDDLLDEARWEVEFFLKMQVPDGTRLLVPVGVKRGAAGLRFTAIDASGMAHHKVGDEHWTAIPTAPHLDAEKRLLFPPSTAATLNLAATAAQCARIWRDIDPAFAARCLSAAQRAWAAARRNPEVYPVAAFSGSGGYGDPDLADEFYWAAAELFATTGAGEYAQVLRASPVFAAGQAGEPGWPRVATLGTITLSLVPNGLAPAEVARLRASLVTGADAWLEEESRVGYAIPYAPASYPWGSNGALLNRAMVLALAHDFTGLPGYRDAVIDAMDYLLGRNPLDQSYISGYGARPMANPHHRFWAHQFDPAYPPPPPGVLSGGPNSGAMSDDVAAPLKGKCAPQACWRDDARAYSLNEVAINWNAPLVWVSAWLAEKR
jgi:endoglucanase